MTIPTVLDIQRRRARHRSVQTGDFFRTAVLVAALLLTGGPFGCRGNPDRDGGSAAGADGTPRKLDPDAAASRPPAAGPAGAAQSGDGSAPPTPPGPAAFGPPLAEAEKDGLAVEVFEARMPDGRVLSAQAVRLRSVGESLRCVARLRCTDRAPCAPAEYLWDPGRPLVLRNDPGGDPHLYALPPGSTPVGAVERGHRVLALCLGPGEERTEFFPGAGGITVDFWAPDLKSLWNAAGLYEPMDGAERALRYDRLPKTLPKPPAQGRPALPETRNQLLGRPPPDVLQVTLSWTTTPSGAR